MILSAIYAESLNHVIGKDGHLPWNIPSDFRWFRVTTNRHSVIMGRKNYMDIGKPLPNRTNYVLTSDKSFKAPGCIVCHDLWDAIKMCQAAGETECFVIGGASVYTQAWPFLKRLYRTEVLAEVEGDVLFPMPPIGWKLVTSIDNPKAAGDQYSTRFEVWERDDVDEL